MKHTNYNAEIIQKLRENMDNIYFHGVTHLGIAKNVRDESVDAELFVIFNDSCESIEIHCEFSDFVGELFPDYSIEVRSQNFTGDLNRHINNGITFITNNRMMT